MKLKLNMPTDEQMANMYEGERAIVLTIPNGMLAYMLESLGTPENVNAYIIGSIARDMKRIKDNKWRLNFPPEDRRRYALEASHKRWKDHVKDPNKPHKRRLQVTMPAKMHYASVPYVKRVEYVDQLAIGHMNIALKDPRYRNDIVRMAMSCIITQKVSNNYIVVSDDVYRTISEFCSAWDVPMSGFVSACLIMGRPKQ